MSVFLLIHYVGCTIFGCGQAHDFTFVGMVSMFLVVLMAITELFMAGTLIAVLATAQSSNQDFFRCYFLLQVVFSPAADRRGCEQLRWLQNTGGNTIDMASSKDALMEVKGQLT